MAGTDNTLLIAAAMEITNPDLALALDARGTWADNTRTEASRVTLYRNYESGEHRASMTDQMRKMLRLEEDGTGMTAFTDNYCELIVSKQADRLAVISVSSTEETVTKWIAEVMDRNNFEALQDGIFRASITDAETMVMIDPKTLEWSIEPIFDGFDGIVAVYDSDSITPVWACKLWSEAATVSSGEGDKELVMKMVVYQPDSVQYFTGKPGADEVTADSSMIDDTSTPTGVTSQPSESDPSMKVWQLGSVPLVRFVNSLNVSTGKGRSAIHSAITLQDILNRTLHSMVSASEFSAFTLLWSIGMEIDVEGITPGAVVNLVLRDKDGKVVTELSEEAAAFLAACKVGQFNGTPMEQYLTQVKDIAREISHNSSTPIYGVTTEGQVSGEAMKQLEVGLIGKVQRYQRGNTEAIKRLIRLTAIIGQTFQNEVEFETSIPTEIGVIHVLWKSAELLDVEAKVASLVSLRKQAPGLFSDTFYRREIGTLLRLRADQIEEEAELADLQEEENLEAGLGADGSQPKIGIIQDASTTKRPVPK